MLLKFLNLGSGFPVKNRLKPFFPFIVRQPENTRHQPALLAMMAHLIQLVVNSRENWKYFMWPTPTINFALLCWIYLSAIYRSVRDCETENECPVDSQNESHFLSPPASDCEGLVLSSVCLDNGWLSSLASGVVPLAASDIARRHQGWRSPGSQVSLYISVSIHIYLGIIADDSITWSSDHHTSLIIRVVASWW